MGERALETRRAPARLAAHQGQFDRRRHQRGDARHCRQADSRSAGGVIQMALLLNEEQSMLRDSARGLISDKAPVSHLRALRDSRDSIGFSRELWKSFAEMGFAGLLVP